MIYKLADSALDLLIQYKSTESADDPARVPDIRGPYEIAYQRKFGKMPEGIWNLREEESRSGLIWQVLSGIMDKHPSFGSAYLSLALDKALNTEEYARELRSLNKSWGDYLDHNKLTSDHKHSAMRHTYNRVACAQCSILAALACQDPGMHDLFVKEILPLKTPKDRQAYMAEKGLLSLLDTMIPDEKLELKK